MKKGFAILFVLIITLGIIGYTQLTLFVIPPIGAVPEGKVVVILKHEKTNFIDSPDAICERIQGKVNLLCRGLVIVKILENSKIIMRLPYNKTLYSISTKGKFYY